MPLTRLDHLAGHGGDGAPVAVLGDPGHLMSERCIGATANGETFTRRQATVGGPGRETLLELIRRAAAAHPGHEVTLQYGADVTPAHL